MMGLYLPLMPSILLCFELSLHFKDVAKSELFVKSGIFVSNIINTIVTTALW